MALENTILMKKIVFCYNKGQGLAIRHVTTYMLPRQMEFLKCFKDKTDWHVLEIDGSKTGNCGLQLLTQAEFESSFFCLFKADICLGWQL